VTSLLFNFYLAGQQSKFASFPPLQRRILEVLDQLMPQHEQGVHVTTIASGLNVQASIDEIGYVINTPNKLNLIMIYYSI